MKAEKTEAPSNGDLWCLLVRTWFAILRLRQMELARFGLTVEQASILSVLRRHGWATAKNLEDITMRQQHSISALISRMTKSGLVRKEKRPAEKRYRIYVTTQGKDLFNRLTVESIKAVLSSLTAEDKKRLAWYLDALHEKVRDLLGISYRPPFLQDEPENAPESGSGQPADRGVSTADYELWSSLDATGFAISRLRELELAQFGLTLEQSLILTIIRHLGGSATTGEIENLTFRQHHSISTLINRMVGAGLVRKEKSPGEKRHRVLMTPEGERIFDQVPLTSLEMVFSTLTEGEKAGFNHCLVSLHTRARELLSPE